MRVLVLSCLSMICFFFSACSKQESQNDLVIVDPNPIHISTTDAILSHLEPNSYAADLEYRFNQKGDVFATWFAITGSAFIRMYAVYDAELKTWSPQQILLDEGAELIEFSPSQNGFFALYTSPDNPFGATVSEFAKIGGEWKFKDDNLVVDVGSDFHIESDGNNAILVWVDYRQPEKLLYAIHDGSTWAMNSRALPFHAEILELRSSSFGFVTMLEELFSITGNEEALKVLFIPETQNWIDSPLMPSGAWTGSRIADDSTGMCILNSENSEVKLVVYRPTVGWSGKIDVHDPKNLPNSNAPVSKNSRVVKQGDSCYVAWISQTGLLIRKFDLINSSWLPPESLQSGNETILRFDMLANESHIAILTYPNYVLKLFDGNNWSDNVPTLVDLNGTGISQLEPNVFRVGNNILRESDEAKTLWHKHVLTDGMLDDTSYFLSGAREQVNELYLDFKTIGGPSADHVLNTHYPSSSQSINLYSSSGENLVSWFQQDGIASEGWNVSVIKEGNAGSIIQNLGDFDVIETNAGFDLIYQHNTFTQLMRRKHRNGDWLLEETVTSGRQPYYIKEFKKLCWDRIQYVNNVFNQVLYCADYNSEVLGTEEELFVNTENKIMSERRVTAAGNKPVIFQANYDYTNTVLIWQDGSNWLSTKSIPELFSGITYDIEIIGLDSIKVLFVWKSSNNFSSINWSEFNLNTKTWSTTKTLDLGSFSHFKLLNYKNTVYFFEINQNRSSSVFSYVNGEFIKLSKSFSGLNDVVLHNNKLYMSWINNGALYFQDFDGNNFGQVYYSNSVEGDLSEPNLSSEGANLSAAMLVPDKQYRGRFNILVKANLLN